MNIISKFTIGSEEGLQVLFSFRREYNNEIYKNLLTEKELNDYINKQTSTREATLELNDLSTQMLTVFADEIPAGYVITKQVPSPELLINMRVVNYSEFYFDPKYDKKEVKESLWNKCLTLTKSYDAMWIEVLQSDPIVPFLKECGFQIEQETVLKPFNQPAYLMVRWKL